MPSPAPLAVPLPIPGAPLPDAARRTGLAAVTALFFMWGFLTCLNDILVPHLKSVFDLSYARASLVQFTFFGAYFLMSLPAGKVVALLGYQRSMVAGLATAAAGTFLFYPAASLLSYGFFLAALFVLASGITLLQVAANPYVAALGKPETASSRLNLAQAFNSLGTTLAPLFGGWLILAGPALGAAPGKLGEAASVKLPYLELTGVLLVLAVLLSLIRLPALPGIGEEEADPGTWRETLARPHLVLGAAGIFLYVGAEIALGSYLVSFLMDPEIGGLGKNAAAGYLSFFWLGATMGRFVGSGILQVVRANVLLAVHAGLAAVLLGIGLAAKGHVAMVAVLAVGLCNSILFPTLFTLGIADLGPLTRRGSSLLIMAIVGGAVVPVAMGKMADLIGVHRSLFIPLLCYLYLVYFGWRGYRPRPEGRAPLA